MFGREPAEQPARAGLKERPRDAIARCVDAFRECVGRGTLFDPRRQRAAFEQRGADLAGHVGAESRDATVHDIDPLAVRAGQADRRAPGLLPCQETGDEGFLAAHHLAGFAVGEGDAGNDPGGTFERGAHHSAGDVCGIGRRRHIRCVHPAAITSDHAAEQDRKIVAEPVAENAAQEAVERSVAREHAVAGAACVEDRSVGADPEDVQAG